MAEIANVVFVGAGAANAAEAIVVTVARTKKAFAQNLTTKEYTEEQEELKAKRVIWVPFWLATTGRNFSTHGNLPSGGDLLHESCTAPIFRLALISLSACGILKKRESRGTPTATSARQTLS